MLCVGVHPGSLRCPHHHHHHHHRHFHPLLRKASLLSPSCLSSHNASSERQEEEEGGEEEAPLSPPAFLPRIGPFELSLHAVSLVRSRFTEAMSAIGASRIRSNSAFQAQLEEGAAAGDEEQTGLETVLQDDIHNEGRQKELEPSLYINKSPGLLGFSFSAAGLLFPYHLGVAQCLIERGLITESTPLSGSSAGAIVSAVIASGLSMQEAMLATKELASDCRVNGTVFRLGVVLRRSLERCLPEDSHIRCSGRIQVAITQVFRSPRGLIVNQFHSKNDLIDALQTSSFIPGYFAPRPVTVYKNRICIDGGLTLFMPPTSAKTTIRICAFPAAQLRLKGIGISPDCNPTLERASPMQLLNWALEPASDEILDKLFDLGYLDALVWAEESILNLSQVN